MENSRKLHLDVDALSIESFVTDAGAEAERGTVQGQAKPPKLTQTGDGYCPCPYPTNPDFDCTYGCQTVREPECFIIELEP